MQSNNYFSFIGRTTRDPEVRTLESGAKCAYISLAVDQPPRRDDNGNVVVDEKGFPVRHADFPRVVAWGNLVDVIEKHLKKGRLISVSGQVRTRRVEKQDGTADFYTDFRVGDFQFLDKPAKSDNGSKEPSGASEEPASAPASSGAPSKDEF